MARAVDRRLKSLEHEVAKVAPGKRKLSYLMVPKEQYDEAMALTRSKVAPPRPEFVHVDDELVEIENSPLLVEPATPPDGVKGVLQTIDWHGDDA